MKTFKQFLKESGENYEWDENIGKFWDSYVTIQNKLTYTNSINNEYNLIIRIFINYNLQKEISYNLINCKGQGDARKKADKIIKTVKNILNKNLLNYINKNLNRDLESVKY